MVFNATGAIFSANKFVIFGNFELLCKKVYN